MKYYNRNYEILKLPLDDMKYLNSGKCADVFYCNDIVFKVYFSITNCNNRSRSISHRNGF